ncbi:MAG: nucleotidyltransferase domain-containing protein [Coriobacteriia bacterium]
MTRPLDIGSALVTARRATGISQRDLGAAVGVAQQQIARWEASGYRNASLERVDAVARALGYEAADLPLAAEAPAAYAVEAATPVVTPVRDLGEITARIREHGRELRERFGIVRIGVFGSFVHGEQTDASDVDLLVEMPKPGGFLFVEAAQYVEDLLGRDVDFIEPHALHPRMHDRVLREAVYVWAA